MRILEVRNLKIPPHVTKRRTILKLRNFRTAPWLGAKFEVREKLVWSSRNDTKSHENRSDKLVEEAPNGRRLLIMMIFFSHFFFFNLISYDPWRARLSPVHVARVHVHQDVFWFLRGNLCLFTFPYGLVYTGALYIGDANPDDRVPISGGLIHLLCHDGIWRDCTVP